MADRVSASIEIGGAVTPSQFEHLAAHIAAYDLRLEWDGEPFTPTTLPDGEPLRLFAHEVPCGCFEEIEQFCCNHGIAYRRWSGSYPGSFGAERIVFDGKFGPLNFAVDEDDHLVLHRQTINELGSMRAIRRYIDEAEIELAAFEVDGG